MQVMTLTELHEAALRIARVAEEAADEYPQPAAWYGVQDDAETLCVAFADGTLIERTALTALEAELATERAFLESEIDDALDGGMTEQHRVRLRRNARRVAAARAAIKTEVE